MHKKTVLDWNAPVILGMTAVSLAILVISIVTGGWLGDVLAIRFTSWADPLMYLRLLTHSLTHKTFAHYTGNFMMILLVGPLIEEKYGSGNLLMMAALTSIVTGLLNILIFPNTLLIGASGIVFMMILLASFVNMRDGKLPVTVILVAVIYLGNEIATGLLQQDNISQISHIIGGLCGAGFGFLFHRKR